MATRDDVLAGLKAQGLTSEEAEEEVRLREEHAAGIIAAGASDDETARREARDHIFSDKPLYVRPNPTAVASLYADEPTPTVTPSPPPARSSSGSPSFGARIVSLLKTSLRLYWRWMSGGAKWRYVVGIGLPLVLLVAIVGGGDKKSKTSSQPPSRSTGSSFSPAPTASVAESPAVLPTEFLPAPIDSAPATPLPPPTPVSFKVMVAKSYRDNKRFMIRAVDDGLTITWDGPDGLLTFAIELGAKNTLNDADSLTVTSASSVVASKAVWSTYPDVRVLEVVAYASFTDQFGAKSREIAARTSVNRATADKFVYDGLRDRVMADNKVFFCISDRYQIHPSIFAGLKDKGCLSGPRKS